MPGHEIVGCSALFGSAMAGTLAWIVEMLAQIDLNNQHNAIELIGATIGLSIGIYLKFVRNWT